MSNAMVYDSAKIRTLSDALSGYLNEFKGFMDEINNCVVEVNTTDSWLGETYTEFKSLIDNFNKNEVATLEKELNDWIDKLEERADSADSNTSANMSIFG